MIPGLGSFQAGLPGIARANESTILQFERVLAHVPDVPLLVLRVPVEGTLDRLSVLRNRVTHDRAANPKHALDLTRHDHVIRLGGRVADSPKMKCRSGFQREVTVVDLLDKVRWMDRRRVLAM